MENLIDGANALTNEDVRNILIAALKSGAAIDALVATQKRQGMAANIGPEVQGTEALPPSPT